MKETADCGMVRMMVFRTEEYSPLRKPKPPLDVQLRSQLCSRAQDFYQALDGRNQE